MLTPGTILENRYQVIRQLGAGGMGAVYLANDLRLANRRVVVKENLFGDPRQFQFEANLLATLSHPNLARVTDHFVSTAIAGQYLVMDYVEGQNLEELVQRQGSLSEQDAFPLMKQIFDAVKYLHANRIIHRDIKPQNIIVTPQGKAVLVDFGIAKVYAASTSTTVGARGVGSPGFAPPEQYVGGTDERSDVYALGATLYYVLTGVIPPPAPLLASGGYLAPPRQCNIRITRSTEHAILKAMAIRSDQRFVSVSALDQTLYARTSQIPKQILFAGIGIVLAFGLIALLSISIIAFRVAVVGTTLPMTNTPSPTLTEVAPIGHAPTAESGPSLPPPLTIPPPTDVQTRVAAESPATGGCSPSTYTVQWGDSLKKIADQFGVSTQAIIAANPGINPNLLYPGQVLNIPCPAAPMPQVPAGTPSINSCNPSQYTVQRGDWAYEIARKFGVSVEALLAANPGVNPNFFYPGLVLNIPSGCPEPTPSNSSVGNGGTYVVRPDDTLLSIAVRFHTTVYALEIANHLANQNGIYPGMTLVLPQ